MLEALVNTIDSIAFYTLIVLLAIVFIGMFFYVILKNLRSF